MCAGDEQRSPVVYVRKFFLIPNSRGEEVVALQLPIQLEARYHDDAIREVKNKGLHGSLCIEIQVL